MKRRAPDAALSGIDLLEEAVHALRLASPATLLCYYAGSAPFVLATLFFWSDMSRSGLAEKHLIGGAIGLSIAFIWMKFWQSLFALKLYAQIANERVPKLKAGQVARAIASQALIQATGLFLLPIAANILIPIIWTYSFYQNATVLGLREPSLVALARRSWKQSHFALKQNHTAMLVLALFGIFLFLNIAITMLAAPHLLKMLAGVETNFTLSFASMVNTTFIAAALGVTYLCFDPLAKTVYVMRCFYGESRTTGEDLRVMLRSFRAPAMAALVWLALLLQPLSINAAAPAGAAPHPATSEKGEALDQSIDKVLQRPEYTWRSPRLKPEGKEQQESTLWKRMREWARDKWRAVRDYFDKAGSRRTTGSTFGNFHFSAEGLIYILIALLLGIVAVLAWLFWKNRSRTNQAEAEATPSVPLPDLESNDVAGDELPVDGWTRLALELLERGELRLAMRAFYFSSLSHLATRSLVSIAKFKSNRDYERELSRRSHALPEVTKTFSENVFIFDRVWYGLHEISIESLQQFRSNVERIRGC